MDTILYKNKNPRKLIIGEEFEEFEERIIVSDDGHNR